MAVPAWEQVGRERNSHHCPGRFAGEPLSGDVDMPFSKGMTANGLRPLWLGDTPGLRQAPRAPQGGKQSR